MPACERRYTHRYRLKVPLVFCPQHSPMTNGHQAKTINISSRGVYFVTSHPVFVGLPVQVYLRMPRQIAGTQPTERIFDGRVCHVEWKDVPSGTSGVGVEFFYWETLKKAVQ
jgi:PilZ domain-containing protein